MAMNDNHYLSSYIDGFKGTPLSLVCLLKTSKPITPDVMCVKRRVVTRTRMIPRKKVIGPCHKI